MSEIDFQALNHSAGIDTALVLDDPDSIGWDACFDVIVVGLGGAGACAALEAAQQGAKVAVIDRFVGGGATATSGSVLYAGGGTDLQAKLGVADDADNMYRYLSHETDGVVQDETLKRFCDSSVENINWLQKQGVKFGGNLYPEKTTYPVHGSGLYFSGNELVQSRVADASPAPRGHIAKGIKPWAAFGPAFFDPLGKAVRKAPISRLLQSRAKRLIKNTDGDVIGVEVGQIPARSWAGFKHRLFGKLAVKLHMYHAPTADNLRKKIRQIETSAARTKRYRANNGIVLSTGGYIFNREMVQTFIPKYRRALRLGTTGDDGSGILLGHTAGAALDHMDRASAWRFINPPAQWPKGILVNRQGKRYVDETMYGASIGRPMFEDHEGNAIVIIDDTLHQQAEKSVNLKTARPVTIMQYKQITSMAHKQADTIEALAEKLKIAPAALSQTISDYNAHVQSGSADPFGKAAKDIAPLVTPPFHAFDMSAGKGGATPCITLGGIRVDERTGQALTPNNQPIKGLYAAGRTAVGVASNIYVSGLSIADGVFSGRRAGHAAANQS